MVMSDVNSDSISSDVQLFESEQFGSVRVVMRDGEAWFVANDVCACLGLSNSRKAVGDLEEDERDDVTISDAIGRSQSTNVISEAGLYSLVLRSRKPEAKAFKRWITHEVLPSIRRTGGYSLRGRIPDDPTLLGLPDFRDPSKAALAWVEERDGRLLAEALVEELRPKAEYCDRVLEANNIYLVTDIAKDYGMSAFAFNRLLGDLGIQYRLGDPRHGRWHLYARYQDKGYTQSMTKTVRGGQVVAFMAWTETGRMFLYQLLKRNGYLPVVEAQEREVRRSAALLELSSSGDAGSREA